MNLGIYYSKDESTTLLIPKISIISPSNPTNDPIGRKNSTDADTTGSCSMGVRDGSKDYGSRNSDGDDDPQLPPLSSSRGEGGEGRRRHFQCGTVRRKRTRMAIGVALWVGVAGLFTIASLSTLQRRKVSMVAMVLQQQQHQQQGLRRTHHPHDPVVVPSILRSHAEEGDVGSSTSSGSSGSSRAGTDVSFRHVALSLLPPAYQSMKHDIICTVWKNRDDIAHDRIPSLTPSHVDQLRKGILRVRDLLDIFSPIYPNRTVATTKDDHEPAVIVVVDVWSMLRTQLDVGYTVVGQYQDLDHAHIQNYYSNATTTTTTNTQNGVTNINTSSTTGKNKWNAWQRRERALRQQVLVWMQQFLDHTVSMTMTTTTSFTNRNGAVTSTTNSTVNHDQNHHPFSDCADHYNTTIPHDVFFLYLQMNHSYSNQNDDDDDTDDPSRNCHPNDHNGPRTNDKNENHFSHASASHLFWATPPMHRHHHHHDAWVVGPALPQPPPTVVVPHNHLDRARPAIQLLQQRQFMLTQQLYERAKVHDSILHVTAHDDYQLRRYMCVDYYCCCCCVSCGTCPICR
jgi:hypothetical protein